MVPEEKYTQINMAASEDKQLANSWHCIGDVMMRQKDHRRYVDAEVKHGAECHTDHQLLCTKLLMAKQWFRKGK